MSTPSDPYNTPPGENNQGDLPSFQPGAADNQPPMPGVAPEPPQSILNAVKLMFVGAGLSALGIILALISTDGIRDQIADADTGLTSDELDTAVTVFIGFTIFVGLVAVALWIWMARANRRGASWARTVATVLGALNILFTLYGLTQATGLTTVVSLATIALAAFIIWFLFRPESSQYYEAVSASRRG